MKQVYGLGTLRGTITLPPDKSIAHRSAMFASIADGISVIRNYSAAADPQTTLACFRQLGVEITQEADVVTVHGVGRDGLCIPETPIDCGNSGTTVRLISGILAGAGVEATLIGDESLSARPMKRVLGPLSEMGLRYDARDQNFLPVHLKGSESGELHSIHYRLPIPSAQVKSCILLAGLFTDAPTVVEENLLSRDHTERLLKLDVTISNGVRLISTSRKTTIPLQNYAVPGDFSAAAFWMVAASIYPNSEITLRNVGINPTRTAALHILKRMGADIELINEQSEIGEPVADIIIRSAALKGTTIAPEEIPNCIDELPILSVAMIFASGDSEFSGAEELRHKESDRLSAVAAILREAGVTFDEHNDGLKIYGNPVFKPKNGTFESLHDHRIAMSAAILAGLSDEKSVIKDAMCTAISYPKFWDDLSALSNG